MLLSAQKFSREAIAGCVIGRRFVCSEASESILKSVEATLEVKQKYGSYLLKAQKKGLLLDWWISPHYPLFGHSDAGWPFKHNGSCAQGFTWSGWTSLFSLFQPVGFFWAELTV